MHAFRRCTGTIIDGFHRKAVDPSWPEITVDSIDNEEKLLIARPVANWHRRVVPEEEKRKWINDLAAYYQKQGLKVNGPKGENQIINRIMDVLGLGRKTIISYLNVDYRQTTPEGSGKQPSVSASERVESVLGPKVAERFRKEVLEDAKLSPEELAEKKWKQEELRAGKKREAENRRKKKVEGTKQRVKEELMHDPEFRKQVAQDTSVVQESEIPNLESEKGLEHTLDFIDSWPEEVRPVKIVKPDLDLIRKQSYLLKAQIISGYIERGELSCPNCGGTKLVWKCCGLDIADADVINKLRKEVRIE